MLYLEGPDNLKSLDSTFSEEEIKNALFLMASDKVPGLDGFLISFHQCFWETLKPDIINLFKELSSDSVDLSILNYSHIVLIPK